MQRLAMCVLRLAALMVVSVTAFEAETRAQSDCQDHVQPLQDDEYHKALISVLLGNEEPRGYVMWPATLISAETVVSLHLKDGGWRVRFAWVRDPVWRYKKDSDEMDFHLDQSPEMIERGIPADLASRLVRDWHLVLERTRSESKNTTTTDGVGYVFSADGLSGEDANLRCGIGLLMNRSAVELARYAETSNPISQWSFRVRIRKLLLRIEHDEYDKIPTASAF